MLVPLTRPTFEQLIPILATGNQYKHYWGKLPTFIRRFSISVLGILILLIVEGIFQGAFAGTILIIGIIIGLYWLWAPVFFASRRNFECRQYKYSGFWSGEIFDIFITEETIGKQQTVNKRGELVIVEDRERRLNLEIGDENGFLTEIQAPLRREHKAIRRGQIVKIIVMSNSPDLSVISKVSDAYLPQLDLWVSDYPFVQRNEFIEISRRLQQEARQKDNRREKRRQPDRRYEDDYED